MCCVFSAFLDVDTAFNLIFHFTFLTKNLELNSTDLVTFLSAATQNRQCRQQSYLVSSLLNVGALDSA